MTSDIVSSHVSNKAVGVTDLPGLISQVYAALAGLGVAVPIRVTQGPAVAISRSVKPDHIVCLEDGKKFKMLKRHLFVTYGMTPADYRTNWKLAPNYPMVAPNYAEHRRTLAIEIGLGRKSVKAQSIAVASIVADQTRGRRKQAVASLSN